MNITKSYRMLYLVMLMAVACKGALAAAQTVPLQNLTQDQFKSVIGDLSSAFMHTSVSGAGTLGSLWGFEIGVIAATTNTPHLQSVASQANSSESVDASHVPDAAILGRLGLPVGLSVEATFLPKVGSGSFQASNASLAAKWTPTDVFGDLPLDLAVKASLTKTQIDFSGMVNSAQVNYDYKSQVFAVEGFVSKNFILFEPYASFGFASAHGDLNGSGTGSTLFDPSYTASSSADTTRSGAMFRVGTEIKFFFARVGLEYANAFASSRFSGKLSVAF